MNAVRDEPYASTFQVHGAATVRSAVSGPSNGLAAVHGCIGSAFTFWTVQVARVTPAEPATRLGLVELDGRRFFRRRQSGTFVGSAGTTRDPHEDRAEPPMLRSDCFCRTTFRRDLDKKRSSRIIRSRDVWLVVVVLVD